MRKRYIVTVALAGLLVWDLSRLPQHQITAGILLAGIDAYQASLSKAMPSLGVVCRFEPSCSRFAEASIRRHGALAGSWRSLVRLARCGPWTPLGTHDPP